METKKRSNWIPRWLERLIKREGKDVARGASKHGRGKTRPKSWRREMRNARKRQRNARKAQRGKR